MNRESARPDVEMPDEPQSAPLDGLGRPYLSQSALQPRATMTAAEQTSKSDHDFKAESQQEQEIYSLMRATGRSRVQVLNAIKVRGPEREAVLRALSSR
ncbi:MAG: hypothetical protein ACXWJM_05060 [Ramlibacter sp.]